MKPAADSFWLRVGVGVTAALTAAAIVGLVSMFFDFQRRLSNLEGRLTNLEKPATVEKTVKPTAGISPTATLADTECRQRERGAAVVGQSDYAIMWQPDCALAGPERFWNKQITLTTWGFVLNYAGNTIVRSLVVPPNKSFTLPEHSSLFAGYSSAEGARLAYKTSNPTDLDLQDLP